MLNYIFQNSPLLYFTQSLWRDEAFSVLVAQKPLGFLISNLSFEPPVYYIMLHFWIRIFGNSEISVRSLSLTGVLLATIVISYWSQTMYRKSWLSWYLPIIFFLNPMILYYAFEVRTYGWYIFFGVLSMYAYLNKKWILFTLSTILGFYTHTYFLFPLASTVVHYVFRNRKHLFSAFRSMKNIFREPFFLSLGIITLSISPWILKIVSISAKLKSSWYFPVDLHLIKSVLGNLFIGYEGTPWYLWKYTAGLSLILLTLFIIALINPKNRERTSFFLVMVFFQLFTVIGISFVKPLFVNRYLITVSIAEIFLVAEAINSLSGRVIRYLAGAALLSSVFAFNLWYPQKHAKIPIKNTLYEINAMRRNNDYIYAVSPLVFFETVYYSKDPSKVFLYNPGNSPFPWYVGDVIFSDKQMTSTLPEYPIRAFMVREDGKYSVSYRTNTGVKITDN